MQKAKELRKELQSLYDMKEQRVLEAILDEIAKDLLISSQQFKEDSKGLALAIVEAIRSDSSKSLIDKFMHKYNLSSSEGITLMALAESLLRVPDTKTMDDLIEDKLSSSDWLGSYIDQKQASGGNGIVEGLVSFSLNLTSKILSDKSDKNILQRSIGNTIKGVSKPIIRKSVKQVMDMLSHKFVLSETIDYAFKNNKGSLFSFDMLGESAITMADADRYFESYRQAIIKAGEGADPEAFVHDNSGVSVKLSAIYPRFEHKNSEDAVAYLTDKVTELAKIAADKNIPLNIDAEEADRLEMCMDIFANLYEQEFVRKWAGLGFVAQAYQKRCFRFVEWLILLAKHHKCQIPVRLVKGAYWDYEIKFAQVNGLNGYPVFTRKESSDISYLLCAKKLLDAEGFIYPQFASHNALTIAQIITMTKGRDFDSFEIQRLHGMGEKLSKVIKSKFPQLKQRVYAPIGVYKDLLPYLVRRLLENGANSSFVHHLEDNSYPIEDLIADPIERLKSHNSFANDRIDLPCDIYGYRKNSRGVNIANDLEVGPYIEFIKSHKSVAKIPNIEDKSMVEKAIETARGAFVTWNKTPVEERAAILEKIADTFEERKHELFALCVHEAGKTIDDAIAEVREAIDFCRYYALQARKDFAGKLIFRGPTGESNSMTLEGVGVFACISPWNFPLAIFTGQVVAALVCGNCVIAKPASQTKAIAKLAIDIMYDAGVPRDVLHFAPGSGSVVGDAITNHRDIAGVCFTGSIATASHINKCIAGKDGAITRLIAETGGQNCMIVDSSALLEQVVKDIIRSSFQSAGQRCSALRVVYVQEDIYAEFIDMLRGAMQCLKIGNPENLFVDVGPVIDTFAANSLNRHKDYLNSTNLGRLVHECDYETNVCGDIDGIERERFVMPAAYEIDHISVLKEEVFGPILHIRKYKISDLDEVIEEVNSTGMGLTFGLHSRINKRHEYIADKIRAGNIYINRNMIGAVVGVQPFGGMGLSGTGPKAGGPHYLYSFATEKVVSIDTTAQGGNASLLASV